MTDGNIDTDDVLSPLVQDGIDGDGRLARLPVADDQFTLPAADRDHTVDGEDPRLQRLVDLGTIHDGRGRELDRTIFAAGQSREAVERFAERVYDAAEQLFPHPHLDRSPRRISKIAIANLILSRKKNGAHAELLEVERQRVVTSLDFQ